VLFPKHLVKGLVDLTISKIKVVRIEKRNAYSAFMAPDTMLDKKGSNKDE
jgi:hypothetical protein